MNDFLARSLSFIKNDSFVDFFFFFFFLASCSKDEPYVRSLPSHAIKGLDVFLLLLSGAQTDVKYIRKEKETEREKAENPVGAQKHFKLRKAQNIE